MLKLRTVVILLLITPGTFAQISGSRLAHAAATLAQDAVEYDPAYFSIDYPNGDVPAHKGVCTDVIIRTYRKLGIDLQVLVHEDMKGHFGSYPKNWGLKRPDSNIDHRRVPNLMRFFEGQSADLKISEKAEDYQPGDIVCWDLGGGILHIGIVLAENNRAGTRPLIMHNIGSGQVKEDRLFDFKLIGHYRYLP